MLSPWDREPPSLPEWSRGPRGPICLSMLLTCPHPKTQVLHPSQTPLPKAWPCCCLHFSASWEDAPGEPPLGRGPRASVCQPSTSSVCSSPWGCCRVQVLGQWQARGNTDKDTQSVALLRAFIDHEKYMGQGSHGIRWCHPGIITSSYHWKGTGQGCRRQFQY